MKTLHVSTQGNDSNPGTEQQPLRTITHAYSLVEPGDAVLVMPGIYTDYQQNWGLRLWKNGEPDAPITLKSQIRGGAVIDGQNATDRNRAVYLDGSFHVLDGFEIRGGTNSGIAIYGNGNQILNNDIHHNGNLPSTSPNGRDGVFSGKQTSENVFLGNYVHDNGRTEGNGKLDHGLYLSGKNELVAKNICARNTGSGIQVAGYSTVRNLRIFNNVLAHNGTQGIILWMDLDGVEIRNNIIYRNAEYGIHAYDAHGKGVVIDQNLVNGNALDDYNLSHGGSNFEYFMGQTISDDPRFLNPSRNGLDVHLSEGSPAIKAGQNMSSVFTTDMDGVSWPDSGPWDLGVYAFVPVPPTSPAPPTQQTFNVNSITIHGPFELSFGKMSEAGRYETLTIAPSKGGF